MELNILESLKHLLRLLVVLCTTYAVCEEDFCVGRTRQRVLQCPNAYSYNPWTNKDCNGFKVNVHPVGTLDTRAIFSFPSSGLSWVLQMIERTSGILTGTFSVPSLNTPETGSMVRCGVTFGDGRTIIQGSLDSLYKLVPNWYTKLYLPNNVTLSSWRNSAKVHFDYRGILLVRNPFNAIINTRGSIRRNLRICASCKKAPNLRKEKDFQAKYFNEYFKKAAKEWVEHVKSWVENSPDGPALVIVKYENLMENPEPDLRRIMTYLNVTMNQRRLKCALEDSIRFQEPIREYKTRSFLSLFVEEELDMRSNGILENGMAEINEMLRLRGSSEYLDYKKPTYSDAVRNKDMWRSRIALS